MVLSAVMHEHGQFYRLEIVKHLGLEILRRAGLPSGCLTVAAAATGRLTAHAGAALDAGAGQYPSSATAAAVGDPGAVSSGVIASAAVYYSLHPRTGQLLRTTRVMGARGRSSGLGEGRRDHRPLPASAFAAASAGG